MSVRAAEVWTALYAQRARVLPVLPLACLGAAEEVSGLALYAQRAGVFLCVFFTCPNASMSVGATEVWTALYAQRARAFLPALPPACLGAAEVSGPLCTYRELAFFTCPNASMTLGATEVSGLALYAQRAGVFLPALTLACLSKLRKSGRSVHAEGWRFTCPMLLDVHLNAKLHTHHPALQ